MIFGRKRKKADENLSADEAPVGGVAAAETEVEDDTQAADAVEVAATPATETSAPEAAVGVDPSTSADRDWAAFDASRDWREEGPFDIEEVDLDADDVQRLDFGSLIVTPPPGAELRLQVAPGTETIVAILVVLGESAIELSVFSAPRTPGLWAEIRDQMIEQTNAMEGSSSDCVEGPFGTELVRNLQVQTADGRRGLQATRTWMAEGPRWVLRGVLLGPAALSTAVDDDVVGPLFDVFSDVVVRRDEAPKPVGDLLPLRLPPDATAQRLPS